MVQPSECETAQRLELPLLVREFGLPVPRSCDDQEERELGQNGAVHDWLQRFEKHLRRFIDEVMTARYGPDWPRGQLPNGLYQQWMGRKQADRLFGRDLPLIDYADFMDYERVICRGDNWKLFRRYFVREHNVREAFLHLHGPRNAVMHARSLSKVDELLAFAEIKRLSLQMVSTLH